MDIESTLERTAFESRDDDRAARGMNELQRGQTISRYSLLERVGAGGMGVVWSAYDPELDRRVAIKLLRPRQSSNAPSQIDRTRLLREAQAMARLSHPNVIAVHDVGEHDGQVFVAMEFIESGTLSRWLSEPLRRSWRDVVAMFVQAGRGLAAAHAAGLVHRDFKPDNVLIGRDGRARVTDFGLARPSESDDTHDEQTPTLEPSSPADRNTTPALNTPLTRTGTMLGTPAYMAPEQFSSRSFDARSDQFSFCVALWEALYGQRPFHGATILELGRAVGAGKIDPPPADAGVPTFIERALRRGLAVEPSSRWPDIDTLLRELERDPALGRRRWLVAGGLISIVLGAIATGPLIGNTVVSEPERCPAANERLAGIWDHARREQLDARLGDGDRWIATTLDDYASEWLAMHQDACADTHVRGEQSEDLLDRRMQCLDERLMHFDATIDLLIDADATVLAEAMTVLGGLPSIARCGDRDYLDAQIPIPDDVELAREVAEVRVKVAEARALVDAGRGSTAEPALREALQQAQRLDYAPLHAQVQVELGAAMMSTASPEQARAQLEAAMVEAVRTRQDELAARAGTELAFVLGRRLGRTQDALHLANLVDAWHERSDAPATARAAARLVEGVVLLDAGESERGKARVREGLALLGVDAQLRGLDQLDATQAPIAVHLVNLLAVEAHYRGDFHVARDMFEATVRMRGRFVPPSDPQMMLLRNNLAAGDFMLGDWGRAQRTQEQLLPLMSVKGDAISTYPAVLRTNVFERELAEVELLGTPSYDALASMVESLRRDEQTYATAGERIEIEIEIVIARYHRLRGELDEAEAILGALPTCEEDSLKPLQIQIWLERGELRVAQGRAAEAILEFEAAERLVQAVGVREQPHTAMALHGKARALHALGRDDEAVTLAREALAIWAAIEHQGHPLSAYVHETLAELLPDEADAHRAAASAVRERVRVDLAGDQQPPT